MKKIYLHGELGEKYGKVFEMDVSSPREACRALISQLDGFAEYIKDRYYKVKRGKYFIEHEDHLSFAFGKENEFHMIPVVSGSKSRGGGKVLIGAALIGVSLLFAPLSGITFNIGVSLILGGVSQMLTKPPKAGDFQTSERPEERASFLFNGPVNQSVQGIPIPLVYGTMRTGSIVASIGMEAIEV